MPNTASRAGNAAPTPAAAELPSYVVHDFTGNNEVRLRAAKPRPPFAFPDDARVCMAAGTGACSFVRWMTPAQARLLAVYLVDCANALDNPAQRVIVDEVTA